MRNGRPHGTFPDLVMEGLFFWEQQNSYWVDHLSMSIRTNRSKYSVFRFSIAIIFISQYKFLSWFEVSWLQHAIPPIVVRWTDDFLHLPLRFESPNMKELYYFSQFWLKTGLTGISNRHYPQLLENDRDSEAAGHYSWVIAIRQRILSKNTKTSTCLQVLEYSRPVFCGVGLGQRFGGLNTKSSSHSASNCTQIFKHKDAI